MTDQRPNMLCKKFLYTLHSIGFSSKSIYRRQSDFFHRDHGSLAKMSWSDPEHRYYTDPRHA